MANPKVLSKLLSSRERLLEVTAYFPVDFSMEGYAKIFHSPDEVKESIEELSRECSEAKVCVR
jgi:hypothetical protein